MPTKEELRKEIAAYDQMIENATSKTVADKFRMTREVMQDRLNDMAAREPAPDSRGIRGNGSGRTPEDETFTTYLRTGQVAPSMRFIDGGLEQRTTVAGNSDYGQPGQVSGSGGTAGGYLVAQGFWENLQVALKAYGGIAKDFKQIETDTGAVMPWATVDSTGVTASVIGADLTQLSPAQDYTFGQGVLNAWPIACDPLLVSLPLVNDSEFDIDSFVAARFGEAIGRELASLALSGTGSSQPLGINPALQAKGSVGTVGGGTPTATGGFLNLATAASVKTFANPTGATELVGNVLSPATLIAMVQSVDTAYYQTDQGRAKFYMSPAQAFNMRGVIDANGRPVLDFGSGMEDGAVGQILGFDVVADASIPALTASTVGGPIFGNLAHCMVQRTVRQSGVMRLDQRWADYLSVGFIGWMRCDVRSNDTRAAVVVKPAAT